MVAETIAKRQLRGIGLTAIGRPRPSFLTPELFEAVREQVAVGKSLKYCADRMGFSEASFRYALANDSQLATIWTATKLIQADAMEDDLLLIADDKTGDVITKTLKDGSTIEVADPEFIARSKVRIDARKWLMARINPKKYGERLEVDSKVTHEVGDSVMTLFGAIRAEQNKERIQEENTTVEAEILPEQPAPIAPASPAIEVEQW